MATKPTTYVEAPRRGALRAVSVRANYDMLLLIGAALLVPALLLLPIALLRVPLGLATALLAPGYALVAALFPRRGDLDGVARAALSIGLSAAILPLLALLLNALPWGIQPWPIAISLMLWIALWAWVALLRRGSIAASAADAAPPFAPASWWRQFGRGMKRRYLLGAAAIALVLAAAAIALAAPDPSARMTEFYALGAEGMAEDYPRAVAPGELMQVQLGIANHEGAPGHYRVEARSAGQLLAQAGPIELAEGQRWEAPLRYALPAAGADQQVDILLFRDGVPSPYRTLRLWVNVGTNGTQ